MVSSLDPPNHRVPPEDKRKRGKEETQNGRSYEFEDQYLWVPLWVTGLIDTNESITFHHTIGIEDPINPIQVFRSEEFLGKVTRGTNYVPWLKWCFYKFCDTEKYESVEK